MPIYLLCLAVFWAATRHATSGIHRQGIWDPIVLYRRVLLAISLLWLLPLSQRDPAIQYWWFTFYFLAAGASILGWTLGSRIKFTRVNIGLSALQSGRLFFLFALPFILLYLGTGQFFVDVSRLLSSSVSEIRAEHWESFGAATALDALVYLASYVAIPFALSWSVMRSRSLAYFGSLLAFCLIMVLALSDASRTAIIFYSFVVILASLQKHSGSVAGNIQRNYLMFSVFIILSAVGLYYFLYVYFIERVPDLADRFPYYYRNIAGEFPSAFLLNLSDRSGGVAGIIAASASYFSSTLTFFERFMREHESCRCLYAFGAYNFSILDLFGLTDWISVRAGITEFWSLRGPSTNPWASSYRDWFIDFGSLGAPVFGFAMFALLGGVWRMAANRSDGLGQFAATYICAFIMVVPLLSPLFMHGFSIPLYIIVFFVVCSRPSAVASSSNSVLATLKERHDA
ncbi:hypothetical protein [Devosia alba]|uniref:hypothetical protein n=1 Tax=Devosia alba TaxID=3152360 RepID=UPI003264295D